MLEMNDVTKTELTAEVVCIDGKNIKYAGISKTEVKFTEIKVKE